jgi:lysylphosphatidylglycerol synthetase-like protein (DUF2156 family)
LNSYQMSKKSAPSEEKPRRTRPSIPALAMMVGVLPQVALATEGSAVIASARVAAAAAAVVVVEVTGIMVAMTTAVTLEVAVALVAMAVTLEAATPAVIVVTLAAVTLEAVSRRGSRNTTLETTKPRDGHHFPPATLVHRTSSRRENRPYLKPPRLPQRHRKNLRPKRLTCSALWMMTPLVVGLLFLLQSTHLDSPHPSVCNLQLHMTVCVPLWSPF